MATYKAVYKCRLCGKVYRNGVETSEIAAVNATAMIAAGVKITEPLAPTPMEVHRCMDKYAARIGLADFQGWEREALVR